MNNENAFYGKFIALSKEAQEKIADLSENELDAYCALLASSLSQTEAIIKETFDKKDT